MTAVETGTEILSALNGRIPLAGVITTQASIKSKNGLVVNVPATEIGSYELNSLQDRRALLDIDIDVLLVIGWQRLIPAWLIDHCAIGAVGLHGSAHGITRGRGRSPQNWAILLGEPMFEFSIFWITPGVDDGPVIASIEFPFTDRDDIVSSQLKVAKLGAELLVNAFVTGELDSPGGVPQTGAAAYLPQRRPEDGYLDWTVPTAVIDRQVRALTRPYPGARSTRADGSTITIWRGRPMDYGASLPTSPAGKVIQTSVHGGFVVATGDGAYLVDDWSSDPITEPPALNELMRTANWRAIHSRILDRHMSKYPTQPVAPCIGAFDGAIRNPEHH